MSCPKGCNHATFRIPGGGLAFGSGGSYRGARRVATPRGFAAAYADMCSRVPLLAPPPQLEFFDDLHDMGGLFIGGEWVVAVGLGDAKRIARRLLGVHGAALAEISKQLGFANGFSVKSVGDVILGAVVGRIMAHELGHALIFRGWENPFGADGEAGADYYAARLDAARGKDWRLGQVIFHSIGCTGASCTHPSPDGRASAYAHGYRVQQAA